MPDGFNFIPITRNFDKFNRADMYHMKLFLKQKKHRFRKTMLLAQSRQQQQEIQINR